MFHITDHTPAAMCAKTPNIKSLGTVLTKHIYLSYSQEHGYGNYYMTTWNLYPFVIYCKNESWNFFVLFIA